MLTRKTRETGVRPCNTGRLVELCFFQKDLSFELCDVGFDLLNIGVGGFDGFTDLSVGCGEHFVLVFQICEQLFLGPGFIRFARRKTAFSIWKFHDLFIVIVAECVVPAEEPFLFGAEFFEPFGKDRVFGGYGFELGGPRFELAIGSLFVAAGEGGL